MSIFNHLSIDPQHDDTLAYQLKQQISWLIASGKLEPGDRLPAVREMAERLGINLHTVRSAYQKLEAEGLVETRRGRGTHVLPFEPQRIPRQSASLRSHTVGVILPSWNNPFYHSFLQGVEQITEQDQTLLFLCNTHDDEINAWRNFAQLSAKQVDGVLVVSHNLCEELTPDSGYLKPALPVVTVDWPGCGGYSAQIDLEMAGYQATQHLLHHGHQRIGLITFTPESANVRPVQLGYARALEEAGLQGESALISCVSGFDMASGAEGARNLLALPQPPGAIFAIADTLALGAMGAIQQAGLRIPQDIALVGFNDIPTTALVNPPLTTVAAPAIELGRTAMSMLRDLIAGGKPPTERVVLPTTLVIRQSCGCQPEP
jgi:DNA-binding LacI/PurR family transcriptional regulator